MSALEAVAATTKSDSTATVFGLLASVMAVILASVVLAYVVEARKSEQTKTQKGTGIFLIVVSSLTLLVSLMYWIFIGVRNSERLKVLGNSFRNQLANF